MPGKPDGQNRQGFSNRFKRFGTRLVESRRQRPKPLWNRGTRAKVPAAFRRSTSRVLSIIEAAGWPIWFIIFTSIVALAIIGNRSELAVVLELVLQLGEFCDDLFAFCNGRLIFGVVQRAMHVVNALGDDDGPSRARRSVSKRGRVVGAVLRWC